MVFVHFLSRQGVSFTLLMSILFKIQKGKKSVLENISSTIQMDS